MIRFCQSCINLLWYPYNKIKQRTLKFRLGVLLGHTGAILDEELSKDVWNESFDPTQTPITIYLNKRQAQLREVGTRARLALGQKNDRYLAYRDALNNYTTTIGRHALGIEKLVGVFYQFRSVRENALALSPPAEVFVNQHYIPGSDEQYFSRIAVDIHDATEKALRIMIMAAEDMFKGGSIEEFESRVTTAITNSLSLLYKEEIDVRHYIYTVLPCSEES